MRRDAGGAGTFTPEAGLTSTPADGGMAPAAVVGIGWSSGGLEALKRCFAAMPTNSGLAFILVPHLDPTAKSLLVPLLARYTPMPVIAAGEGLLVEPNRVYVQAPDSYLSVRKGVLRVTGRAQRAPAAIDLFFTSLADDYGEKAVGILLSGTRSYGIRGLGDIRANGGLVVVQDPQTATSQPMPLAAIAAGLADFVLRVEEMPRVLLDHIGHYYVNGARPEVYEERDDGQIRQIVKFLHRQSRTERRAYDFQGYHQAMLKRRIERRMGLLRIETLSQYHAYLQEHPQEVQQLIQDLLISVTSFFRDPFAFQALEQQVLTPVVQGKASGDSLRVWVPGCSTGEEAYSIGMLLLEHLSAQRKDCVVQIFATDVNPNVIAVARKGIFPEGIAADLTPPRLRAFFIRTLERRYQIIPAVRALVTFAVHDVNTDPPICHVDLVSCRNLLIYLNLAAQSRVLQSLHRAINPGGYLFLGSAESTRAGDGLFKPISPKFRIYQRDGIPQKKTSFTRGAIKTGDTTASRH
jgi:two-component system CheB/CheR fusion protein